MSRFGNSRRDKFLADLPDASFDGEADTLTKRSKFNFSYFLSDPPGQGFNDWTHSQLVKLLDKLKDYSRESLAYWENQHCGAAGRVLSIYGGFPSKSAFAHPKAVPSEARWARFRLEQSVRLVGFVVPTSLDGRAHSVTKKCFCSNTFYVVFLDRDHQFYQTEAH